MKPYKILLFLISLFVFLYLISLIIPKKGFSITDNFVIDFPDLSDFLEDKKPEYADISEIIKSGKEINADSLLNETDSNETKVDTLKASADSLKKAIHFIEFPDKEKNSLNSFFKALSTSSQIHVMHFGDSQIEGDRITNVLRNKLQNKFGGYGVGFVPAVPISNASVSIKSERSEEWERYTILGEKDSTIQHERYGILGSYARFAPFYNTKNEPSVYEAWLKFKPSNVTYYKNKKYDRLKLFYGYNKKPVLVEVYKNEQLSDFKSLMSNKSLKQVSWSFNETPEELKIKFSGKDSPEIYGLCFESDKGILVDNISMRGSAGLDFTRMDMSLQKQIFDNLNTKLLILEFGVNVVPNKAKDYAYYKNWFYHQLSALKRVNPGISILVVGVSDMSKKTDTYYESYSNISKIRDAQKAAAFKAGCAFWDLYEAMGGENSMPSWVFAEPPLANKDFTHFNYRGAKIIGQMFYNAIIYEYKSYRSTLKAKPEV